MELETILNDKNWEKLGACKIECINVFDASLKADNRVSLPDDIVAINERIQKIITVGTKPKTEIDLLKEQNAELMEKMDFFLKHYQNPTIEELNVNKNVNQEPEKTEKEIREALFAEAKELGLTPAKNVKTDILKDLIDKAKK